jgi:hypothetical protein
MFCISCGADGDPGGYGGTGGTGGPGGNGGTARGGGIYISAGSLTFADSSQLTSNSATGGAGGQGGDGGAGGNGGNAGFATDIAGGTGGGAFITVGNGRIFQTGGHGNRGGDGGLGGDAQGGGLYSNGGTVTLVSATVATNSLFAGVGGNGGAGGNGGNGGNPGGVSPLSGQANGGNGGDGSAGGTGGAGGNGGNAQGGGIYQLAGSLTITATTINSNSATAGNGGAGGAGGNGGNGGSGGNSEFHGQGPGGPHGRGGDGATGGGAIITTSASGRTHHIGQTGGAGGNGGDAQGGGVYQTAGSLTLTSTTITGNAVTAGEGGNAGQGGNGGNGGGGGFGQANGGGVGGGTSGTGIIVLGGFGGNGGNGGDGGHGGNGGLAQGGGLYQTGGLVALLSSDSSITGNSAMGSNGGSGGGLGLGGQGGAGGASMPGGPPVGVSGVNGKAAFVGSPGTGIGAQDPDLTGTTGKAFVSLTPGTLPASTVGVAYNQTITGNGASTLSYTITSGSIPSGLTFTITNNQLAIIGTPTASGSVTFSVTASDASNDSATLSYTLTINSALSLSTDSLPVYTLNTPYNQVITTSGGTGASPMTYSVTYGAIPQGLSIYTGDNELFIYGTPTSNDNALIAVTATDAAGATVTQTYRISSVAPASQLAVAIQPPATVTAGAAFTVQIDAEAPNGQVDPLFFGNVSIALANNPTGTTLGGTLTVAAVNGVATFSDLTVDKVGTGYTLQATSGSLTSVTTNSFNVVAAAASTFTLTGFPSPTTAGTAGNFTVTAYDPFGNVATGYLGTVHFTSSDGQAVLPSDYTFKSGDQGQHNFSATLKTAGSQSITATDTVTKTITGTQSGIVVNPAALDHLGFVAPTSAKVGTPFSVTVTAQDAYNNTITSFRDTIHFACTDKKAVLPKDYVFTAGDMGVHTFSVTLQTAGNQIIGALDTAHKKVRGGAQISVSTSPTASMASLVTTTQLGTQKGSAATAPAPAARPGASKPGTAPNGAASGTGSSGNGAFAYRAAPSISAGSLTAPLGTLSPIGDWLLAGLEGTLSSKRA